MVDVVDAPTRASAECPIRIVKKAPTGSHGATSVAADRNVAALARSPRSRQEFTTILSEILVPHAAKCTPQAA